MATRTVVVIPWRPTPDRQPAFDVVTAWYRSLGLTVLLSDSDDTQPFCLAQARNRGVRAAQERGADVVVVSDADTFGQAKPLLHAIAAARLEPIVHLPYDEYRALRHDGTAQLLAGRPAAACNHLGIPAACSGILVTTPSTWWSIGGQDEGFRAWGMEDVAMLVSHRTLLGREFGRVPGHAYAMFHLDQPTKGNGPQYEAGVERYHRYLEAAELGAGALREVMAS